MKTLSRVGAVILGVAALGLLFAGLSWRQSVRFETMPHQSQPAKVQLSGAQARAYLEQSGDGKSLAQAITAARFGLDWQESGRGESKAGGGYLGMSHEQNLNAWFAQDGVTVRPTLPEEKRDQGWTTTLHLKSWGYGTQLAAVPPIISRTVNQNRIEYQRRGQEAQPRLVEWYENRAEGIEQGFILSERPTRGDTVEPNESLRLLLAISGDLRAQVVSDGSGMELRDQNGKGTLSYSKLVVLDADGRKLAARMEASAEGREIALVVEDTTARYPIVIDPFIASLEQKLRSDIPQVDARFGFAVAIDGNMAVVGAWREDVGANPDVGAVYVFIRTGAYPNSSWALDKRFGPSSIGGQQCGWSVAISGNRIVFGCPGENSDKGTATFFQRNGPGNYSGASITGAGFDPSARFGTSIAISGDAVVVGAPATNSGAQNAGHVYFCSVNTNGTVTVTNQDFTQIANAQLSAGVAVDVTPPQQGAPSTYTAAVGLPGTSSARIYFYTPRTSDGTGILFTPQTVQPTGGTTGDQFGQSVAVSGNTAVIGAYNDNTNGTSAGAAYVFTFGTNGTWTQQQKLTALDGVADDFFSFSALAISGNTIVIGAYGWDAPRDPNGDFDERGAAYVFSRSGTTWTQQSQILPGDSNSGDNFGISVGVSGDTAIIGARRAPAVGTVVAGAAYVYRLPHRLGNIATRLRVETGDNTLIGGFIVSGTQNKRVIVRAIGPSLALVDKLANPTLELYQGNSRIAVNDNWVDSADKQAIIDSGVAPTDNLESAIIMSLPASNSQYTAIVRGADGGTGTAVVQLYDLDNSADSKLANISTRGLVQTGDNVLFAGTIVVGEAPQKVIIRALGPSVPVPGRMSDPTLELFDGNGASLESNDNWVDSPNKQAIIDSGIPPNHDLESAIVRTLPLGTYTAIVRGFGGSTGIAVVEVYALN
ncbi:MAG: hypothetical protein QOE26_2903 [Verrucomicrobiota bacterium]